MKEHEATEPPASTEPGLTPEDVEFIHVVFGKDLLAREDLDMLLEDDELRQQVLDCRSLFYALRREGPLLGVSEAFYYYILSRQVLLEAELSDPRYTAYVSRALVKMAHLQSLQLARDFAPLKRYYPAQVTVVVREEEGSDKVFVRADLEGYKMVMEGSLETVDIEQAG